MSDSNSKTVLDRILNSVITRDGTGPADTMLVNAHLSQMKMFGIRQGVEFFPQQDNFGTQRFDFIQQVIKFNKLDARLDSIWDRFLAYGKGLFYIRPTKKTYRIYWFDKDSYRTYYSPEGDLEEVILIYPYKVKSNKGIRGTGLNTDKRYMRLRITPLEIEETHTEQEINFDQDVMEVATLNKTVVKNTMQFIPCVEVFNNPDAFGTDGAGEFEMLANQIIAHDEMVKNIRANLSFFGNPTLLSSRPKQDIVENDSDGAVQRPSISSQSGFGSESLLSSSTYKQDPITRQQPGYLGKLVVVCVYRVIANLEPSDRVGFITPNAVSTDQARYSEQLRSEIRLALGGIDDLSITNVTATEIKSAYGRVSATAKKKCLQLYQYGICKCFELIIFQEEQIFRKSLAFSTGIKYPEPPVDEEDNDKAMQKYEDAKAKYEQKLDQTIEEVIRSGEVPVGVLGLAPDGDRTVLWRWMGPVYEDTAQDKLNQSIFVRNLQELGVDSIEALKYLFPSKTDDEIAGMLSGFPFRVVGELQRAYSGLIDLVNQEMRTPHPQQPNLPIAADPRLNLTPFLYRTLESLQKEVTYAGRYRSADPIGTPSIPDPADQLGAPVAQTAAQAPTVATTPQWTAGAQPMAAPAPQAPAQMGVQGIQYSPTPSGYQAPQAPQPQQAENPYRDAFDKVVNLLSSPVQFPFQGQQSTTTPSGVRANYGSQATTQYSDPAAQTYMPSSGNSQGYSNASSQTSTEVTADQLRQNGVSEASLEVINHFGADAPALLNNYACQIEDSLVTTNGQLQEATGLLQELVNEHKAYEKILTNPDILADYTCEFFGPNGPHPVEQEAPANGRFVGQQFQQQAPAPQRPEMPAPPQPQAQQGNPEEFWNSFGNLADRDPAQAWKYLNAAQQSPEIFRQKLLVME